MPECIDPDPIPLLYDIWPSDKICLNHWLTFFYLLFSLIYLLIYIDSFFKLMYIQVIYMDIYGKYYQINISAIYYQSPLNARLPFLMKTSN